MRTSLLNLPQVQRIARTTCRRMARHAAIILAIPSALPHCHGAQRKPSGSARPSLSRTRNECGRAPIDGHGGGRLRRASNRFISGKATGLIGSVNDTMGVTMPGGAARTFADPYEYQAFTCDAQHRVVVTKAGAYRAKTIRIDLHRVMLRRARQALPTISHLAIPAGRRDLLFGRPAPDVGSLGRQGDQNRGSASSSTRAGSSLAKPMSVEAGHRCHYPPKLSPPPPKHCSVTT